MPKSTRKLFLPSTTFQAGLVHVFKNWKLLFENIYRNTCRWKSALKYVKCYLKTENDCLKTQTKHPPHSFNFCLLWAREVTKLSIQKKKKRLRYSHKFMALVTKFHTSPFFFFKWSSNPSRPIGVLFLNFTGRSLPYKGNQSIGRSRSTYHSS